MMNLFNTFSVEKFDTEATTPIKTGVFSNGFFQERVAPIGKFVIPTEKTVQDFTKYGLTVPCEQSFEANHDDIPKIPVGVLREVIRIYRKVSETISSEVYTAIVWDRVAKDFFIHIPEQEVSAATISYENTADIYNNNDLCVIMDIHSHNVMDAFFSSVDLADEKATRYFGVIGKIAQETPAMVVRAACNQVSFKLAISDIFSDLELLHPTSNYTVDDSAFARIKERKAIAATTYGFGVNSSYYDKYPVYKSPSPSNYMNNPFNTIYTKINAIRYATAVTSTNALYAFIDSVLECTIKHLDDTHATDFTCDMVETYFKTQVTKMFETLYEYEDPADDFQQSSDFATEAEEIEASLSAFEKQQIH